MSDTTAKILAKGCQSTGVTEELARKYHDDGWEYPQGEGQDALPETEEDPVPAP